MKLITYDADRVGLLVDGRVADISELSGHLSQFNGSSMARLIHGFSDSAVDSARVEAFARDGAIDTVGIESVVLKPPIPDPSKIICTVDNYPTHAGEFKTEIFPKPIFFLKPATSLLGSGGCVLLPQQARRVDYELELALIIGTTCHQVPADQAWAHIFGYTILLDMSARDYRTIPYSWFSMKGWDTFCPVGPTITTADEVLRPQELAMNLWVNGELRMSGNTKDMIFSIPQLIEAASEVATLLPGDIIATGTIAGVASVLEGDSLIAEIETLGKLEVNIGRNSHEDVWHVSNFAEYYAAFRERDMADTGPDPIAPKDERGSHDA